MTALPLSTSFVGFRGGVEVGRYESPVLKHSPVNLNFGTALYNIDKLTLIGVYDYTNFVRVPCSEVAPVCVCERERGRQTPEWTPECGTFDVCGASCKPECLYTCSIRVATCQT
jgi:hypothetical protein